MNELARLLLELGVVFAVLAGLSYVAGRIALSPIPFFLLAGLFSGNVGPVHLDVARPFLHAGAEIGVIILLLMLGLEFSASEFVAGMRRQAPSGVVDFLLNATPGFVAGFLIGLDYKGACALAVVTWVSSSGIIARLLEDLGRLANRETPSVLSVLVLEDIAIALVLPVLVVVLFEGGILQAVVSVGLAVGALVLIVVMARRAGDRFQRVLSHPNDDQVLLRILGVTFVVAGLMQSVGASAAVGAFLVGLAVPMDFAERARVVLSPMRTMFASVFFYGFAISINPHEVVPYLLPAGLLALVTALTKVGSGWYAAGRDGVRTRGRLRAGLTLIARGEFSIVVAGIAVSAGVTVLGPFVAAYVLILAVVGPVLARFADPIAKAYMRLWTPRKGKQTGEAPL